MLLINKIEGLFDRRWGVLLVSAVLVFIVLAPYLLGFLVLAGDGTEQYIPQMSFYKKSFQNGETPFWTPGVSVGFPAYVTNGYPYNPFYLPLYFLNPITAHYWGLWVMLSLTLFFAISCLRELNIGIWGSWIGGLGYLMGNIFFASSLFQAAPLLTLPIVFWILIKIYRGVSRRKFLLLVVLGAAAVANSWLLPSGYFANFYIFLAGMAFAFFLGFKNVPKNYFGLPLALSLIFVLGTLIGLLQLVPAFVAAQSSGRAGGISVGGDVITIREFLDFTHLRLEGSMDAYLYMGIVGLLFLIISFFSKNSDAKFFRWVFFIALAIAVEYSPLYWFLHQLPPFKFFQGASRSMMVGMFAAAVLAGFGAERFVGWLKEHDLLRTKRIVFPIIVAIGAALVLSPIVQPLKSRHVISLLFAGLFLFLVFLIVKKTSSPLNILPFLAMLAAADFVYVFLYFYHPRISPGRPLMVSRRLYQERPPAAEFLRNNPGRIFFVFPDDFDNDFYDSMKIPQPSNPTNVMVYGWKTYSPNSYLLYGVDSIEAYDPLLSIDVGRLMALLGAGRELLSSAAPGEQKLDKLNLPSWTRLQILKQRLPLANFLGIRYFVSGYDLQVFGIDLPSVASAEVEFMRTARGVPTVAVFENINAKPIAYFSPVTAFAKNKETAYALFKNSEFNGVFVECRDCENKSFSAQGLVEIQSQNNGLLVAKTDSAEDQFLVFSQNYLPGWKAYIDGEEAPAYKVNTVFGGIIVPAGEHEVKFHYDYWSLFDPSLLFGKTARQLGG